ncbi:serine hydrolase [Streptomyces sp. NPDC091279]|uniref:serine hydrolase n=1 Tax=Streptomyces sp. NPDC091279 TaxID=3365983 RepID=UPI00382872A9
MPGEPLAVHPLSFLRQTRGWGKAEFARLMQAHGRSLGIPLATNRTTVWKWEQGQEPDADAQRVLADLLRVPYEQAPREGWPRWLPVWEVTGLTAPWTEAGTVEALSELVGSGRMDRRGFLTITGVALTGLAASWVDAPSAFASALDGDQVTDTMVSTIEQRISTLRTLDDQLGGATLLEQARGDLALVTGLLSTGRYTESIRIRLYALARMYAALISEVDGTRLLAPETLESATREQTGGKDQVMLIPSRFSSGYMLPTDSNPMAGPHSFGHTGRGGSLGFADPHHGIAFGYVMNNVVGGDDVRAASLADAVRRSLR